MMNDLFYYSFGLVPVIPHINEKPPTLYAIMNSMVNYGQEEQTKIKDLPANCHDRIFNFSYPLSEKINKTEFECLILNHFMMRRIGFDTMTAFQIQLNSKLNEIMPMYNKLFDLLYNNDLFGEITKKDGFDNRQIDNTTENTTTNSTNMRNTSNTNTSSTYDKRYSDTPQNNITNVKNGNYVTDYTYDTNTSDSSDTTNSNGTSNTNTNGTNNTTDKNTYQETISHIDMFDVFIKMNENIKNIYTMIFKDLDCLFYQLV